MTGRLVALFLFSAFACIAGTQEVRQGASQNPPGTSHELSAEDYAVYSALVRQLGGPEDPEEAWQGKEMLILDTTVTPTDVRNAWNGFKSDPKALPVQPTLDDFAAKARSKCVVKAEFGDGLSHNLVAQEEIDKFFKKGHKGWDRFYKLHPKAAGFWSFSRPGYDVAHDEAVLYVSHSCGWLCGTGHLYFLVKQNGQWSVRNRTMLWIS